MRRRIGRLYRLPRAPVLARRIGRLYRLSRDGRHGHKGQAEAQV